jgi:hypothetical protein
MVSQNINGCPLKNLDAARRDAVAGVYRRYAMLHDKADADNVAEVKSAGRYMGDKGTADKASTKLVDSHLRIERSQHGELDGLAHKFRREMADERRRYEQQNRELADLADRHARESRVAYR